MENTYKVEAKCGQAVGVDVEFKGINDIGTAFECANNLEQAFPTVYITNEYTGEVVHSRYIATDFFHPAIEMGKAIYKAECEMHF